MRLGPAAAHTGGMPNNTTRGRRRLTIADVAALLTAHEVSDLLGVSIKTLRNWRYLNRGPAVTYVGSQPRYREADVLDWVQRSNRAA